MGNNGSLCLLFNKHPKRPRRKSLKAIKNIEQSSVKDKVDGTARNLSILPTNQLQEMKFNWSSMQNVLLEINSNVYSRKITRQDIITADQMLSYIDQDILYHCKTLLDRLLSTKRTYMKEFEEHANNFRIIPKNNNKDGNTFKCLLHNFHMIHLHKKILNALQFEGNPFEMLDLLALSHAVMRVTTSDFKLMNVVFCKYLSTLEFDSEVTIRPLIQYLNVITNYVCNSIEKFMKRENMVEEITTKDKYPISSARKNYRQLKKWHAIADSVTSECQNIHKESMTNVSLIKNNSEEILITTIDY